jgi:hypothetical protein
LILSNEILIKDKKKTPSHLFKGGFMPIVRVQHRPHFHEEFENIPRHKQAQNLQHRRYMHLRDANQERLLSAKKAAFLGLGALVLTAPIANASSNRPIKVPHRELARLFAEKPYQLTHPEDIISSSHSDPMNCSISAIRWNKADTEMALETVYHCRASNGSECLKAGHLMTLTPRGQKIFYSDLKRTISSLSFIPEEGGLETEDEDPALTTCPSGTQDLEYTVNEEDTGENEEIANEENPSLTCKESSGGKALDIFQWAMTGASFILTPLALYQQYQLRKLQRSDRESNRSQALLNDGNL